MPKLIFSRSSSINKIFSFLSCLPPPERKDQFYCPLSINSKSVIVHHNSISHRHATVAQPSIFGSCNQPQLFKSTTVLRSKLVVNARAVQNTSRLESVFPFGRGRLNIHLFLQYLYSYATETAFFFYYPFTHKCFLQVYFIASVSFPSSIHRFCSTTLSTTFYNIRRRASTGRF